MDPNRLTQRSQEALSAAQSVATGLSQTETDNEHLLVALLEQPEGLVARLLRRLDIDVDAVIRSTSRALGRRPRVSGPGVEPGQIYTSRRLSQLIEAADAEAKRLKDEYVSVEHLFLALIDQGGEAAVVLIEHGVSRDGFLMR